QHELLGAESGLGSQRARERIHLIGDVGRMEQDAVRPAHPPPGLGNAVVQRVIIRRQLRLLSDLFDARHIYPAQGSAAQSPCAGSHITEWISMSRVASGSSTVWLATSSIRSRHCSPSAELDPLVKASRAESGDHASCTAAR